MTDESGQDIAEAYKYLNITPNDFTSDQYIINAYRSRLEDTSASNQPQLKQMLLRLGNARQSQRLLDAATDGKTTVDKVNCAHSLTWTAMETYEQALAWLGAEASWPDESILTLHTAKVSFSFHFTITCVHTNFGGSRPLFCVLDG